MALQAPWKSSLLTSYIQQLRRPSKRHFAGLLLAIFLLAQLRRKLARAKRRSEILDFANMAKKAPSIPGFTPLSDQVFVRSPEPSDAPKPEGQPDVVLIYGWGDGLPKHVAKYADGFRVMFPRAKQILILSPISKALFTDLSARSKLMLPVLTELFPNGPDAKNGKGSESVPKTILAHTMSNTGAVNYAATINAFRELYSAPFPHQLLSMDSTPGSTHMDWSNLVRWSRAMALGTASFFPWPFVVTQSIWGFFLMLNGCFEGIMGRESAGGWSRKAVQNTDFEMKNARKLYMYSKEDDLIGWKDIEDHAAETRKLGWQADVEVFEGSGHVGHMRKHGEQYWKAILDSWNRAMARQK